MIIARALNHLYFMLLLQIIQVNDSYYNYVLRLILFIFTKYIFTIIFQTCLYCMFVAVMAFFAKVSDPAVGGTYMTLLNTVTNLGTNWPNTLALWAIDHLTYKNCTSEVLNDNTCATQLEVEVNYLISDIFF